MLLPMILLQVHKGRLDECELRIQLKSPFLKLVVQIPPLYIKPRLKRAEAEAIEQAEAVAEADIRRSAKKDAERERERHEEGTLI